MKNIIKNNIELLRYLITGVINNGVFFLVYYTMLNFNINYKVSYFLGSISMIIVGFLLNKKWVFRQNKKDKRMIIKYLINIILFIVIGMKLTELLILSNFFNKYSAAVLAVIICALISYVINKKIVFEK